MASFFSFSLSSSCDIRGPGSSSLPLCLPLFLRRKGRRALFFFLLSCQAGNRDIGKDCSAKSAVQWERKLLMNECQYFSFAKCCWGHFIQMCTFCWLGETMMLYCCVSYWLSWAFCLIVLSYSPEKNVSLCFIYLFNLLLLIISLISFRQNQLLGIFLNFCHLYRSQNKLFCNSCLVFFVDFLATFKLKLEIFYFGKFKLNNFFLFTQFKFKYVWETVNTDYLVDFSLCEASPWAWCLLYVSLLL